MTKCYNYSSVYLYSLKEDIWEYNKWGRFEKSWGEEKSFEYDGEKEGENVWVYLG